MWCLDCLGGRAYWVYTSTFNFHFRKEKHSLEWLPGRVAHTVFFSWCNYSLRVVVWSKQRTAIAGKKLYLSSSPSCPLYCRSSKGGWRVNLLVLCQLSVLCFHAGKVFSWLILPRLYSGMDFRIWPKVDNYSLQYSFSGMDNKWRYKLEITLGHLEQKRVWSYKRLWGWGANGEHYCVHFILDHTK